MYASTVDPCDAYQKSSKSNLAEGLFGTKEEKPEVSKKT
jgi:hypothetical protein